jgi:hypothetical protein
MRAFRVLLLVVLFSSLIQTTVSLQAKGGGKWNSRWHRDSGRRSRLHFEGYAGYAAPLFASYIDTYQNQDIYWNPNSGINLDVRLRIRLTDHLSLTFPADFVFGIYQYYTTDGRKINTEAQAGNAPKTVNTEWSIAPNFAPMLHVYPSKHPACPYLGIGIGIGALFSFESWDFTNVDGNEALLVISKFYYPSPQFKGEIGWNIPVKNGVSFNASFVFNLANYVMYRVVLTNYYINGTDTIGEYNERDTIYSYAFSVPDENKGGDCLLAGFAYQNYPQQKISTNLSIKIGFSYNFANRR